MGGGGWRAGERHYKPSTANINKNSCVYSIIHCSGLMMEMRFLPVKEGLRGIFCCVSWGTSARDKVRVEEKFAHSVPPINKIYKRVAFQASSWSLEEGVPCCY